MLWDMYQNVGIAQAKASAARAAGAAAGISADVGCLTATIDRLLMVNRAMWEIMRDHQGLSDETLMAKMQEIDLRDGKQDGRWRKDAVDCPQCGRKMHRRHPRCLYCGAEGEHDVFDLGH